MGENMKVSDFDYFLPEALIAQTPLEPRDSSRLMVVPRDGGPLRNMGFSDITDFLEAGDVLVLNDSRVLPARLLGARVNSQPDEAPVEVLLLREVAIDTWECLVKPGRKFRPGAVFSFSDGQLEAEVVSVAEGGERVLHLRSALGVREAIRVLGSMPLPPYITAELDDPERYQTVYSRDEGSAAAPTAGLHFTRELLERVRSLGVAIASVTLHVGVGTFRPVKVETLGEHRMHAEYYEISPDSAASINGASGRVWCVGTTSLRAIESSAGEDGIVSPGSRWTDIFIFPGYRFRVADALITNFHLPKSTLLMLVAAFGGKEHVMEAYRRAIEMEYRFFSFGDAMLLI